MSPIIFYDMTRCVAVMVFLLITIFTLAMNDGEKPARPVIIAAAIPCGMLFAFSWL